jgi:hypothetical protein
MPSKKGLSRPAAPIDIYTLQPDPDLAAANGDTDTSPKAAAPPRPAAPTRKAPQPRAKKKAQQPQSATRIKTSIELSEGTLDLIQQIKTHHRHTQGKHYPLWKILEDAIRQFAKQETGKSK